MDSGDDQAALLKPGYKPLSQIVQDDSFREFEFRQYLFACQSKVCKLIMVTPIMVLDYYIVSHSKKKKKKRLVYSMN